MSALLEFENQVVPAIHWEFVMRKNEQRLYNFIRKRVANFADVDDLVQSTWLEVLRNKHKFTGASRPETWVFGIAINLVKNHYKSLKVSYLHDDIDSEIAEIAAQTEQPEGITEDKDTLSKALQRIAQLPTDYQNLLQLVVENDISYQEVAAQMAIPIGTVRSRLSRVRQSLKQELQWECVG